MIRASDYSLSLSILDRLTGGCSQTPINQKFSDDYQGQGTLETAIKILHSVSLGGSEEQRLEVFKARHKIISLNNLLADESFLKNVSPAFGYETGDTVQNLKNLKVAVPPTDFERMIQTASRIPRLFFSLLTDLLLLPVAGLLVLWMCANPDWNPKQPKNGVAPILLLHGSGFNESQWVLGRRLINNSQYGSVFSLNYDGLITNDPKMGIDDYAAGKVRDKILEIQRLTGQNRVILIGHSMGGMVAGYYAEHLAERDQMQVEHVISVASPWKGSPAVDALMLGPNAPKRYEQMSSDNSFRKQLVQTALRSERQRKRKYYSIGSTMDVLVPHQTSLLSEDPRRQRLFTYMGHFGIVASWRTWGQVRLWLNCIYEPI